MIADLKPYPKMKNSGVPWLGKVPEHWGLMPNRSLIRRRKILVGEKHTDFTLLSLTKRGVIVRDLSKLEGKFSADMGTCQKVWQGDFVFCLFDVPETPRTVGLSRHNGMITGAYTVFESLGKCIDKYFEMFYIAMDDRKMLGSLYSGLRNTIPAPVFLQVKSPAPPLPEQTAIVRYLDYVGRRVRRLVLAKQKMIGLLTEQKQAIIHRAVTRGLDPDVPLKDSGVEWLGKVPAHWEAVPLCSIAKVKSIVGLQDRELLSVYLNLGVVRFSDVKEKRTNVTSEDLSKYQAVDPGDLVLNNQQAWRGSVGVSRHTGIVSPAYLVLSLDLRINPQFANLLFRERNMVAQYLVASKGVGSIQRNLYWPHLKRVAAFLPPLPEQAAIVRHLDQTTALINTSIIRAKREIELLNEYRTRLIADVVTGKLDVREAAAKLPEEPEQMDELEDLADEEEAGEADSFTEEVAA